MRLDLAQRLGALSIGALVLAGCKSDPEPAPAPAPEPAPAAGGGAAAAPAAGGQGGQHACSAGSCGQQGG